MSLKFNLFGETVKFTPIALIIFIVILLRLPNLFEPYWYGDEAIYLTLGEGIRQGLTLYKDIFDHKPPLIYLVAALAGSLFWFKFLLLVSHAVTVLLFSRLAEKLLSFGTMPQNRQKRAAILATLLFALFTTLPTLEGNIANAELFLALPTVAGLLFTFSGPLVARRLFLAGIIFSFAILYKVPAALEIAALIGFWWITNLTRPAKYPLLAFHTLALSLGVVLPILVTGVYYWFAGALAQYIEAGLSINFGYLARWSAPALSTEQFDGSLTFRAGVLGTAVLAILFAKKYFDPATLFVSLWFLFALFAMLLSGRPYPHYAIQVIAPLSLLVTILVNGAQRQRFWTTPFILLFLAALNFYQFYYYPTLPYYQNFLSFVTGNKTHNDYLVYFDSKTPTTYKIAQSLVASTRPQDRIFIWGTNPELYALTRRLPPGRFTTSFHITDFNGNAETMAALAKTPPEYIIFNLKETRSLPQLTSFMQTSYVYLETAGDIEIWKRVNPALMKAVKR